MIFLLNHFFKVLTGREKSSLILFFKFFLLFRFCIFSFFSFFPFCRSFRFFFPSWISIFFFLFPPPEGGFKVRIYTPVSSEWALDTPTFRWILRKFGPFELDLFATRWNTMLPEFVSPCPDPEAIEVNALSLSWNRWNNLFISPANINARGPRSPRGFQRPRDLNSPLLAQSPLVHPPTGEGSLSSSAARVLSPVAGNLQRDRVPRVPRCFQASRLETLRTALAKAGMSEAVIVTTLNCHRHKESTIVRYQYMEVIPRNFRSFRYE